MSVFVMSSQHAGDLQGDIPEDATLSESGGGDVYQSLKNDLSPFKQAQLLKKETIDLPAPQYIYVDNTR